MGRILNVILGFLLFGVLLSSEESFAQSDSVSIYYDSYNKVKDTIDFTFRTEDNAKVDSFIIENKSSDTLSIGQDAQYINRIGDPFTDDTWREFLLESSLPFFIPPKSKKAFLIRMKVDTADKGPEYLPGYKKAKVFVNVSKAYDTSIIVAKDTFYLRGTRTTRFMTPKDTIISFGDSYVDYPQEQQLLIYNGTNSKYLTINADSIVTNAIFLDTNSLKSAPLLPNETKRISVKYTPLDINSDTLSFLLTSTPGSNSAQEVSRVIIMGRGVEQRAEIDRNTLSVNQNSLPNISLEKTSVLKLDAVKVDTTITFSVLIKNTGNLDFTIDTLKLSGDVNAFTVVSKNGPDTLLPGDIQTIVMSFKPTIIGPYEAQLILTTDLLKRMPKQVFKANAEDLQFTIKAKGSSGRLEVRGIPEDTIINILPNQSKIDPIQCVQKGTNSSFSITNIGDKTARIDSIYFKYGKAFFINQKSRYYIEPKEQLEQTFEFRPPNSDTVYKDELIIESTSPYFSATVIGKSIESPNIIVSIPKITGPIGQEIKIPIEIDKQFLNSASRFSATITLDENAKKIVQFVGIDQNDTDTKGITPNPNFSLSNGPYFIDQIPITISADSNDTFNNKFGILCYLVFKPFFSEYRSVDFSLTGVKLGTSFCQDLFDITKSNGKFIVDTNSLCGDSSEIAYIFDNIRNKRAVFTIVHPDYDNSVSIIQHFYPYQVYTDIALYSLNGERVSTIFSGIASKELQMNQLSTIGLAPGIYYCVMKAQGYCKGIPIIIHN